MHCIHVYSRIQIGDLANPSCLNTADKSFSCSCAYCRHQFRPTCILSAPIRLWNEQELTLSSDPTPTSPIKGASDPLIWLSIDLYTTHWIPFDPPWGLNRKISGVDNSVWSSIDSRWTGRGQRLPYLTAIPKRIEHSTFSFCTFFFFLFLLCFLHYAFSCIT